MTDENKNDWHFSIWDEELEHWRAPTLAELEERYEIKLYRAIACWDAEQRLTVTRRRPLFSLSERPQGQAPRVGSIRVAPPLRSGTKALHYG